MQGTINEEEFRYAVPLSERQRRAALAWKLRCANGACPLPFGPEWDVPFICEDGTLVFSRPADPELLDIRESYHWGDRGGARLCHQFRIVVGCVVATIDIGDDWNRSLILATELRKFLQENPILVDDATGEAPQGAPAGPLGRSDDLGSEEDYEEERPTGYDDGSEVDHG